MRNITLPSFVSIGVLVATATGIPLRPQCCAVAGHQICVNLSLIGEPISCDLFIFFFFDTLSFYFPGSFSWFFREIVIQ